MSYGYNIEHTSYTEVTREADSEDSWDRDDLSTSWDIGVNISESDSKFPDIVSSFKLDLNKNYYLVYVIHSTGDSFHHHDGYQCQFIEIFTDQQAANNLKNAILNHHKDYNENRKDLGETAYSLPYKDELGNDKKISCDWNGYFESIENCVVHTVNLQLSKKSSLKYKK